MGHETSNLKQGEAYGWVLLSGLLFSVVFACPKLADHAPTIAWIVFIRYFGGFLTLLPFAFAYRRKHGRIRQSGLTGHLARAFTDFGSAWCLFYAVQVIPLANAVTISMTDGVLCILLAAVFLRERIGFRRMIAVFIALIGAVVLIKPVNFVWDQNLALLGSLSAFAAAIFSAFGRITYRYLATQETAFAIVFYLNGILALATLPIALACGPIGSVLDFWPVLLMGPIAALGQLCNVRAYALQEASFLAPVQYCSLLFSGLIGFLLFAEIPGANGWIGAILILVGAILTLRMSRPSPVSFAPRA